MKMRGKKMRFNFSDFTQIDIRVNGLYIYEMGRTENRFIHSSIELKLYTDHPIIDPAPICPTCNRVLPDQPVGFDIYQDPLDESPTLCGVMIDQYTESLQSGTMVWTYSGISRNVKKSIFDIDGARMNQFVTIWCSEECPNGPKTDFTIHIQHEDGSGEWLTGEQAIRFREKMQEEFKTNPPIPAREWVKREFPDLEKDHED